MSYLEYINKPKIPDGYWNDINNLIHFMEYIAFKEGYIKIDDWYKCSRTLLNKYGLNDVYFKKYGGNLCSILNNVYKSNYFLPWKFEKINHNFWNDINNQKRYMDWLFNELGYEKIEDWYEISIEDFSKNCGYNLYQIYNSIIKIFETIYPNFNWLPWKFHKCPQGFWNDINNQRIYMNWLFKNLGYEKIEDWYKINQNLITSNYGFGIINYYKGSPYNTIKNVYNEYNWLPWKFEKTPFNFWSDINNQKIYMDWLFKELGYETLEDWYKIKQNIIIENYGNCLLQIYNGSPSLLLKSLFSNYNWLPWKFQQCPLNFWSDINNQKIYMDWLFKELGYETLEDWYKIKESDFKDNYGRTILKYYDKYQDVIIIIYNEYEWLYWKFKNTPSIFWENFENQKLYIDWLFKKLGYETMEDWYKINQKNITDNDGFSLLNFYKGSPQLIIKSVFKNYNWLPWKFENTPLNFWNDINNQKLYMDWLFKELGYETMEDWYRLTKNDLVKNHSGGLIVKYNKFTDILKNVYKEYKWDELKFNSFKGERIMNKFLTEKYNKVLKNVRFDWCKNPKTNKILPFDFCIEEFKIIIELDGKQHFSQVQNWDSPENTRKRDLYKMEKAIENGYSMIRILWDDVYKNENDWKLKITGKIQKYENPKNFYLGEIYNNFKEYQKMKI